MNIKQIERYLDELTPVILRIHTEAKLECVMESKAIGLRDILPKDGPSAKSKGIYIFTKDSGEVIYIGKAGVHMHSEVWGKIKTPVQVISDGRWHFPNNAFMDAGRQKTASNEYKAASNEIETGNAMLAVWTVNPSELCSLVEVYLQTRFFFDNKRLPSLNLRIG